MLKIKPGVRPFIMKPEIILAIQIATEVFDSHNFDCVITSLNDGQHMKGSLHYAGHAVDFRIKHVGKDPTVPEPAVFDKNFVDWPLIQIIYSEIREALGGNPYQTLLESDHIHIEVDWKTV